MKEETGDYCRERAAKRRRVEHEGQQKHERRERSNTPSEDRERGRSSTPHRHHHHHHHHDHGHHHHHHHHHRHHSQNGHPHRHRHHSSRRHSTELATVPKELPFGARQLSRGDLATFRPLFAYYLDLQKQLDINSLDEIELRGRWKSFMGKWNRGELAEGWYDPEIFQRAISYYADESPFPPDSPPSRSRSPPDGVTENGGRDTDQDTANSDDNDDDDDEDAYVPPPPPPPGQERSSSSSSRHRQRLLGEAASSGTKPPGPSIPTRTDLSLRDEAIEAEREAALEAKRLARRAQRKKEKELLDEVAPRAEAGTRERRLEKRRELNEKLRAFRERSPGGAEVGEGELMGGAGDAADEYRAMVRQREERRRERISRREEIERARRAEREERLREYREREERVVAGLRELARQRFGVP
ncbi:hypothetical protein VTH82DRAFT_8721 [Thermothelomyces myriococcoides]